MRIQIKVLLLLIPLVIGPVVGLAWIGSQRLGENAREQHLGQIHGLLNQLHLGVSARIGQARSNVGLLAQNKLLRDFMVEEGLARYSLLEAPVIRLLKDYQRAFPDYYELRVLLPDGSEDLRVTSSPIPNRSENEAVTGIMHQLSAEPDATSTVLFRNPDTDQPALLVAQSMHLVNPARDPVGTPPRFRGYLAATVSLAFIRRQLYNISPDSAGEFLVTDLGGNILFASRNQSPLTAAGKLPVPELALLNSGAFRELDMGGRGYVGLAHTLDSGLMLIGLVPQDEVRAPAVQLRRLALYLALLVTLLTVLIVYAGIDRLILRRIRHLSDTMRSIGRGAEIESPDCIRGNDEVSDLTRTFYQLHHSLRDSAEKVARLAYSDPLTGLPNKTALKDNIERVLEAARRGDHAAAVMFLDLDNFKNVNDALGHQAGDALLQIVSEKLRECTRASDFLAAGAERDEQEAQALARLGGDEFSILLPSLSSPESACIVAERIIDSLSSPISLEGHEVFIGTSIGISIFPTDGESAELLLKHADVAMYRAKSSGKNTYRFFDRTMNEAATQRLEIEASMRTALEEEQFHLHFQPRVSLRGERVYSFEALLRWEHPQKGPISPGVFIPISEESGFIRRIGDWVLEAACRQAHAWIAEGRENTLVSVNLSPVQISYGTPLDSIKEALSRWSIPPESLEIEITEGGLVKNEKQAIELLTNIRNLGVRIALDDFGTGYSSLAYLRRLPIDTLKIDRSFVSDLAEDRESVQVFESIIDLAGKLRLETVAEGVETSKQLDIVNSFGCDSVQGYFFAKPLAPDEAIDYFDQKFAETDAEDIAKPTNR